MDGFGAFGELPLATLRDADVGATGIAAFRFSEDGYISEPGELPANVFFEPRLAQPIAYSRSLQTSDGFAGRVADATGEIDILNQDGFLDALYERYSIDGRQVTVKRRRLDQGYADAETVFDGTAVRWDAPEGLLRLQLRDNLYRLSVPVQPRKYGGTGGSDGGADLAGKPIPLAFGKCREVPLVQVDATALLYQFHDGRANAVLAVYDSGDLLTLTTEYTVDLAAGTITLLQPAVGLITADVEGSATSGHYIDSTAYIIKRILLDHAGVEAALLSSASFDAVDGATAWSSAAIGFWIGPEDALAIDVVERLLVGIGGFLDCEPSGLITLGLFGGAWYGDTFALDETVVEQITRVPLPSGIDPPNKRRQVAYQNLWSGPQLQGLASVVSAARRSYLALAYRTAVATGSAGNSHILATDPPVVAAFYEDESAAAAFAAFLIELYGVERAGYQLTLFRGLWSFKMGMTGTLTYPAWNLRGGKPARVVSIAPNAAQGRLTLGLFV